MTATLLERIKQFKQVSSGIEDQEQLYSQLGLTAHQIEDNLAKSEYKAIIYIPTGHQTATQKKTVQLVEKITGFGSVIGEAFEEMLLALGRVPTQKEYAEYCTDLVSKWWTVDNRRTEGILWSEIVQAAVYNRQLRSYTSHLVELHALLTIKQLFPEWKAYCSNDIDLLMGVDVVVETSKKRLYLHIFKNSQSGFTAFHKKEKRGGRRDSNGKFHKFKRNFSGDKTLQFDWKSNSCSESTQFINGNPLFKPEYLETQLLMFDKFVQFGEKLTDLSKMKQLDQFLQKLEEQK